MEALRARARADVLAAEASAAEAAAQAAEARARAAASAAEAAEAAAQAAEQALAAAGDGGGNRERDGPGLMRDSLQRESARYQPYDYRRAGGGRDIGRAGAARYDDRSRMGGGGGGYGRDDGPPARGYDRSRGSNGNEESNNRGAAVPGVRADLSAPPPRSRMGSGNGDGGGGGGGGEGARGGGWRIKRIKKVRAAAGGGWRAAWRRVQAPMPPSRGGEWRLQSATTGARRVRRCEGIHRAACGGGTGMPPRCAFCAAMRCCSRRAAIAPAVVCGSWLVGFGAYSARRVLKTGIDGPAEGSPLELQCRTHRR